MRTLLLFMIIFVLFGCTEDATVGSSCELLHPSKWGITKIEQKNLDCRSLDGDALCVSYVGNDAYCTQKCGPKKIKQCDPNCEAGHSCIYVSPSDEAGTCLPNEQLCGVGKDGTCHTGLTCNTTTGRCEASDCPSGYICHNPVELLGHPFTGAFICIEDPGACLGHETCGGNGKCSINETTTQAECECYDDTENNITYYADNTKLQCVEETNNPDE